MKEYRHGSRFFWLIVVVIFFEEPLFKDFGKSKEREIIDFLSKKVTIRKLPF